MEYAVAKVSTKGQIVIPSSMRKEIAAGDEFLLIKQDDSILLKGMNSIAASLRDDLRFAERVERAWREHDKGKFKQKSKKDFLAELRAC